MKIKRISNSGGFVFLETLLITMLLAAAAMLIMSGFHSAQRISRETAIRTAAIHLANARLAELLYQAATGNSVPNPTEGDITADDILDMSIEFRVASSLGGNHATVTVSWTFDGVDDSVEVRRDVYAISGGSGGG